MTAPSLTAWPPALAFEPPRGPEPDDPRPDLHPERSGVDPQEYPESTEDARQQAEEVGKAIAREWAGEPVRVGLQDARRVAAEYAQALIAGFLEERNRLRGPPTPRGYQVVGEPSGRR